MGMRMRGVGPGLQLPRPDRPIRRGTLRRIAAYFKPYRWQVLLKARERHELRAALAACMGRERAWPTRRQPRRPRARWRAGR